MLLVNMMQVLLFLSKEYFQNQEEAEKMTIHVFEKKKEETTVSQVLKRSKIPLL